MRFGLRLHVDRYRSPYSLATIVGAALVHAYGALKHAGLESVGTLDCRWTRCTGYPESVQLQAYAFTFLSLPVIAMNIGHAGTGNSSLLLHHLLAAGLNSAPEQEIVYGFTCRLTYRKLSERVKRLGSALQAAGAKPGTMIGVMDWDSHRYLECYFAIPMLGAVLHTINIKLSPEQILYTINHAHDDIIIVNRDFLPLLQKLSKGFQQPVRYIVISDRPHVDTDPIDDYDDYEQLLSVHQPLKQVPDLDENACATTFYTTGTTGNPKGVFFSHRQLVLHTLALQAALLGKGQGHIDRDDVYMPLTPMFHVHAWGMPYVATALGLKQVYPGQYAPQVILDLIRTEGVTFSHCVPTVLQLVLNADQADTVDLGRWTVVIGGSALSQSLVEQALARGIDIFGGYGLSETCPVLTLAQLTPDILGAALERQIAMRCMAGRSIGMVSIRVVDPNMQDLPRDGSSQGEIVLRAPWLTAGYLGDAAASEQLWRGGWLHTGDIGYFTPDGYLKVTDRLKDVIKCSGEWISSLQLEDLLSRDENVQEVAVFGILDDKWGERPIALVVPKPGKAVVPMELKRRIRTAIESGNLPRQGLLTRLIAARSLTRTSVGKLDKKFMRETYRRHSASDDGASCECP